MPFLPRPAMLGHMEEARSVLDLLRQFRPGVTVKEIMEGLPPVMRRIERYWAEGLRRAGLPED